MSVYKCLENVSQQKAAFSMDLDKLLKPDFILISKELGLDITQNYTFNVNEALKAG